MRAFAAVIVIAAVLFVLTPAGAESFFLHRVEANYPQSARDQDLDGNVTVLVHVNKSGHVRSAQIAKSSGHSILDDSALRAAVESTYVESKSDMTYAVHYTFSSVGFEHRASSTKVR